eukprot:Rhum_TRINITY_DN18594_c0_g1::Rhum_TRINITY_DN18594_c0_g1_i1::g.167773::m.167773
MDTDYVLVQQSAFDGHALDDLEKEKIQQKERIAKLRTVLQDKRAKAAEKKQETFTPAERARVLRIFKKFDTDESGTIDEAEFVAMFKSLGVALPESEVAGEMKHLCRHGRSTIGFATFLQWWVSDQLPTNSETLSEARKKLRALASSKGDEEKANLKSFGKDKDVFMPFSIDAAGTIGGPFEAQSKLTFTLNPFNEEDFLELAETRFADAARPALPDKKKATRPTSADTSDSDAAEADSDSEDSSAPKRATKEGAAPKDDEQSAPSVFGEVCLELVRPCPNEDKEQMYISELNNLVAKGVAERNKSLKGRWVWADVDSSDLPRLTLRFAISVQQEEKKALRYLMGTTDPDPEDVHKLQSALTLSVDIGHDLDVFGRALLEGALSLDTLLDEGLSTKLTGEISPAAHGRLQYFFDDPPEKSNKGPMMLLHTKMTEMAARVFQGVELDVEFRNWEDALQSMSESITLKVRDALPEEVLCDKLDEELEVWRKKYVLLGTRWVCQKGVISAIAPLCKLYNHLENEAARGGGSDSDSEEETAPGPGTFMSHNDVLLATPGFVKEITSFELWTKYQSLSLEATNFALFSCLPSSKRDVHMYMIERRVSEKLRKAVSDVRSVEFPLLERIVYDDEDEKHELLFELVQSVMDEHITRLSYQSPKYLGDGNAESDASPDDDDDDNGIDDDDDDDSTFSGTPSAGCSSSSSM